MEISFFDYAKQALGYSFDTEEFCRYLAFHERDFVEDLKAIAFFLESFLDPENIQKSIRSSVNSEGYSGKMIMKSGDKTIKLYAVIDISGICFIKIGINDSVQKFENKDALISALNSLKKRFSAPITASEKTASDFNHALSEFLKYCNTLLAERFKKPREDMSWHYILEPISGSRYVKLVNGSMLLSDDEQPPKSLSNYTSRSAWAFIDKTNGDILKPASWSAPAKHARANIYNKDTWGNVTSYGPKYL